MKKIFIAIIALVVLLGAAGGGAYVYFFKMHHAKEPKTASLPPPKPLLFAQIDNLVVSVPTGGGDSSGGQVFVQLSVQFATTDSKAIDSFNALQPIVQSEIVNLLMKQTATQLMNPDTHNQLSLELLAIANSVLEQNQYFKPANPFTAAYITNIVQQD